jgi:hypothetical protein
MEAGYCQQAVAVFMNLSNLLLKGLGTTNGVEVGMVGVFTATRESSRSSRIILYRNHFAMGGGGYRLSRRGWDGGWGVVLQDKGTLTDRGTGSPGQGGRLSRTGGQALQDRGAGSPGQGGRLSRTGGLSRTG